MLAAEPDGRVGQAVLTKGPPTRLRDRMAFGQVGRIGVPRPWADIEIRPDIVKLDIALIRTVCDNPRDAPSSTPARTGRRRSLD